MKPSSTCPFRLASCWYIRSTSTFTFIFPREYMHLFSSDCNQSIIPTIFPSLFERTGVGLVGIWLPPSLCFTTTHHNVIRILVRRLAGHVRTIAINLISLIYSSKVYSASYRAYFFCWRFHFDAGSFIRSLGRYRKLVY